MGLNTWWNAQWKTRRIIKTTTGSPHTSGVHFLRLDTDLDQFVSDGKLRSDYADLRIICQKLDHNINIPYYIAENPSPKRIFFVTQHDINENENIGGAGEAQRYYVYYENPTTYDQSQPDTYININFPQAPYSVHADGYETPNGTYFDRKFFKLNDDPAAGPKLFTDSTGRPSGLSKDYDNVQKGHSGILDQSTFFDGSYTSWNPSESGSWIHIPGDFANIDIPSGNWAVDFWMRIHPKSAYSSHYGSIFSHSVGSGTHYDEPYPWVYKYFNRVSDYSYLYGECNFSFQQHLTQRNNTTKEPLASGEWHHVRVAYRTGGGFRYSRIHVYCDGKWVDQFPHTLSNDTVSYAENTSFFDKWDTAPSYIGWRRRVDDVESEMFTGWLEQLRYSSFVFPGISGTADPADPYHCAPSWVDTQYIATLGPIDVEQSASGDIGGILQAIGTGAASGDFGGALLGRQQGLASIGGAMFAISDTASGVLGGFLWSTVITSGSIGGLSQGSYGDIEVNTVEGLNRALIKAHSDTVTDQTFKSDASFALYGSSQDNFDAKLNVDEISREEFDASLLISKVRFNPSVVVTDITHTYSGFMPTECTIIASGHAYDVNNNQIASGIHYVSIIWGDNDYTEIPTPIASGSVWSATHVYSHSGLYKPIVIVRDKYGRTGSNYETLNLASGVDIPYISLSGQPRSGYVPPQLTVNFEIQTSGILGSHTVFWDFGNGISYFNNAITQIGQYAMPGEYTPWVRLEDERNIYVIDTLRIGYNI